MRKLKKGRKFGRVRNQRKALFLSLASSLVLHGKIQTTEAKAKELRRYLEPVITKARSGTVVNRKLLEKFLTAAASRKLFSEIGPKLKERRGGYVRIIKIGKRGGDAAPIVSMEIIT